MRQRAQHAHARIEGEEQAVGLGREPEQALEDIGGKGQIGHEGHAGGGKKQQQAAESPVAQHHQQTAQRAEGIALYRMVHGLAQQQCPGTGQQAAEQQAGEDAAPVGDGQQGQHGRQDGDGLDPGDDFFHGPAAQHVLDDGQGHGADAAAADGLHGAPEQQGPDGLGQGQEQAGDHIEQGARVKHGLAAVFVAERAPEEHGGPEEQQKAGDAQAGEGVRGLQGLRHVRQGRQGHVGGKGGEGAQEGKIGNQPAVAGGKNFFGHTGTPCPRVNEGVVPC